MCAAVMKEYKSDSKKKLHLGDNKSHNRKKDKITMGNIEVDVKWKKNMTNKFRAFKNRLMS